MLLFSGASPPTFVPSGNSGQMGWGIYRGDGISRLSTLLCGSAVLCQEPGPRPRQGQTTFVDNPEFSDVLLSVAQALAFRHGTQAKPKSLSPSLSLVTMQCFLELNA